MTSHLNDEQMTDWLLGTAGEDIVQHLASCEGCRAEASGMQTAIAEYARSTRAQAEVRRLQPVAAASRLSAAQAANRRHWLPTRLSWVASFALLALAAILLMTAPSPQMPTAARQDADDALLMEIQQQLERDVPEALAPAAVLTAERNRVIAGTMNQGRSQ
jgi:predicted anti-sigma-YlaC factor YlaD